MNSTNSKSSEKTSSPQTDNQQSGDSKCIWNKISAKDDEPVIDQAVSPELANLESIEHHSSAFKTFRQNGFTGKRFKLDNGDFDPVDVACHFLSDGTQDDCDVFGRNVAVQLRQMNKIQKFLSQRLISEVLFRGQIQALQMSTVLNNQSTVFQQQPQQVPLPVYTSRPVHFSRGSDYNLMIQGFRHQPHIPVSVASVGTTSQSYQSYASLPQQNDHVTSGTLNHVVNLGQNENL